MGSADATILSLESDELLDAVEQKVKFEHMPFLGICVGLQILFEHSEEDDTPCLGWLPGRVVQFPDTVRVPQIGYNEVRLRESIRWSKDAERRTIIISSIPITRCRRNVQHNVCPGRIRLRHGAGYSDVPDFADPHGNLYAAAARERLRGPAMRVRKKLGVCYVLMVLLTIAIVIPIIWLVFISMKPNSEIMNNPLSLPNALDFGNYVSALQTLDLFTLYKNTAFIAVCSLAVEIVITFSSAVGLTRLYYRSDGVRSGLQGFLQLGLAVSPFILLFPIYKINKFLGFSQQLSLILPYIATSISFNTLLFTAYLRTVPKELDEAALMDGVSLWQLMTKILVPIAKPVLATVIIFNLLYIWNEYPFASIMIEKPAYYTISRGIAAFQGQYNIDYGGLAAYSVMVLLPELVFYGIFQRHVVDGMTVGAVKG